MLPYPVSLRCYQALLLYSCYFSFYDYCASRALFPAVSNLICYGGDLFPAFIVRFHSLFSEHSHAFEDKLNTATPIHRIIYVRIAYTRIFSIRPRIIHLFEGLIRTSQVRLTDAWNGRYMGSRTLRWKLPNKVSLSCEVPARRQDTFQGLLLSQGRSVYGTMAPNLLDWLQDVRTRLSVVSNVQTSHYLM